MESSRPAGGTSRTTVPRSCATSARGAVRWRKASADSASSARISKGRWSRRPTAAARASASTRSKRSRSTISIPAVGALLRHGGLQPGLQVLPELGNLQVAGGRCAWASGPIPKPSPEAARQLGCRSVAFTYNDPVVWAEYAIDSARACRAAGREDRGGHRRLHHAPGPPARSTR